VQIVRRLHADLALPGEIVGCPTVREADGLALSSRNGRLSPVARRAAAAVPRALRRMVALTAAGERAVPALVAAGQSELDREAGLTLDYLVVVDGERLEPVSVAGAGTRALIAVTIDGVRLIDTMAVPADDGAVRPRDEENIDGGR
jgi:pantoate--beta-alanine ligase